MKPIPLSAFIPPVTGQGGRASNVHANSFDFNNLFPTHRPRVNSTKRMRSDDDLELEHRFDLTRDYPPLIVPERQNVDLDAVSALMVGAAEAVPSIRAKLDSPESSKDVKELADFGLKMFDLLSGLWERVVRPAVAAAPGGALVGGRGPKTLPKPDTGKKELLDVLRKCEKTAILYDTNLGTIPIANRQKLNHALSAGIREAAVSKAEEDGVDPAEAVRVTDDALSLVTDMSFMGQASRPVKNKPFCSLPIRMEFEDKGARIHFERTIKAHCGVRATMSLPPTIRAAQTKFYNDIKDRYKDEIVMVRVNVEKLRFMAFHKVDKGPKWLECMETEEIPHDILARELAPRAGAGGGGNPMDVDVGVAAAAGPVLGAS